MTKDIPSHRFFSIDQDYKIFFDENFKVISQPESAQDWQNNPQFPAYYIQKGSIVDS